MDEAERYFKTRRMIMTKAYRPPFFKVPYQAPVRVRLIRGEYPDRNGVIQPFLETRRHWNETKKKYQFCSSKWVVGPNGEEIRDINGPLCVGCFFHYSWTADQAKTIPKRTVGLSKNHAVTCYVMADFHLNPFNREGQPMGPGRDGKPIFIRDLCVKKKCPGCKQELEIEWGHRMAWLMSGKVGNTIIAKLAQHKNTCASCGTKKSLECLGYCCPSCGDVYRIQAKDDTDYSEEEVKCPGCQSINYPTELLQCNECDSPRRPSMFDADLWVVKTGSGNMDPIMVDKVKIGPPHKKIDSELLKPLNLQRKLSPEPLEVQLKIHDTPSPFPGIQVESKSVEWGKDGAKEDEDIY